ncbi:multiple antibiotic resistance protein [Luteimonas cucumeris]|uniref:UPF0056 membrane protein n=1 Tax=Luteimonas cucumeris TaxID=985012 RepID=A0A562L2K5_9GAMM|nr:MarC family NAAT transporter [Luteimonas cucumeris]TWI01861.1 multiple antibiotic resistance protein [Luteimonas cucumeris]
MTYGLGDLFGYVTFGLLGLLPIANPLSSAAVLLALTARHTVRERNRVINRNTVYVVIIMLVCYYVGNAVMSAFGVSIPGLRLAGGMIVAYIGFTMLFPSQVSETETQVDMAGDGGARELRDIAFIPLAIPVTSGPGTIAYIISAAAMAPDDMPFLYESLIVLAVVLVFAVILWICLRGATQIRRFLGDSGLDAFSRIMGFVMVCIGMQFIINGTYEILKDWQIVTV